MTSEPGPSNTPTYNNLQNVNNPHIRTPQGQALYADALARRQATQQITTKITKSDPLNLTKDGLIHRYYIIDRNPPDFYFAFFEKKFSSMVSCGLTKFRINNKELKRCIDIILDKEKNVNTFAHDAKNSEVVKFTLGRREIKYTALDPEVLKNEVAWVPRIIKTMTLNFLPACLQSEDGLIKEALKDYADFTDDKAQSHVSKGCYRQKMTLFVKKFKKIPKSNFNLPCLVINERDESGRLQVSFDTESTRAQYEVEITCTGRDDDPDNPTPVEPNDLMCSYCFEKGHKIENCAALKRRENQRFRLGAADNQKYFCMRCKQPGNQCTREICVWAEKMLEGEFPPIARRNFPTKIATDAAGNANNETEKANTSKRGKNSSDKNKGNKLTPELTDEQLIAAHTVSENDYTFAQPLPLSPGKRARIETNRKLMRQQLKRCRSNSFSFKSPLTQTGINFNTLQELLKSGNFSVDDLPKDVPHKEFTTFLVRAFRDNKRLNDEERNELFNRANNTPINLNFSQGNDPQTYLLLSIMCQMTAMRLR